MNFKEYIKVTFKLAIPMIVLALMQSSLSLIDQLMIKDLGQNATTAIGISGKFSFLFFFLIVAFGTGIAIFAAQYIKQNRMHEIKKLINISYIISAILIFPYIVLSLVAPEVFFKVFTDEAEIIQLGSDYQRYMSIMILTTLFTPLYVNLLRSTGNTGAPLIAGFVAILVNTTLNYALIYGNLGFESKGIAGAGIATAISKVVELIIIFIALTRYKFIKYITPSLTWIGDKDTFKKFMIVVLPALGGSMAWATGEFLYSYFYAKLGIDALTAFNVTQPMSNIIWGILTSFSAAFGIIIGNTLGEGKTEDAYRYAKYSYPIALSTGVVFMLLIVVTKGFFLGLFDEFTDSVIKSADGIMYVLVIFLPFKITNMVTNNSILRSGGKTYISLLFNTLGIYLVGVPLSIIGTMVLGLDIVYAYALVSFEEVVRSVFGIYLVKSKKWINTL